ncbi:MAG: hypothetical protein ABI221_02935 [Candidatus Saccharimonadales bacterium]
MDATYWHKQSDQPLYDDLLWSRPEHRAQAGKLLILGGNLHGFAAAALAYQTAGEAGIGEARIILPDALQKTVGRMINDAQFAPSTSSGSFAKSALASWLDEAAWADGILLAGDFGRNSQTAALAEAFLLKYRGPATITKDAVDMFYSQPQSILNRPETCLVLSLAQLQKLASLGKWPTPLKFEMGQLQLVEWLHQFSKKHSAHLVMYHNQHIYVAVGGRVSQTKVGEQTSWRVRSAAQAAVWWLQNPSKPFEALTTAVFPGFK